MNNNFKIYKLLKVFANELKEANCNSDYLSLQSYGSNFPAVRENLKGQPPGIFLQ